MRNFLIGMIAICALLSAPPLLAQHYQPATSQEIEQLQRHRLPKLETTRGGDDVRQAGLNAEESTLLAKIEADYPESRVLLRDLRGGFHVVIIVVPCIVVVLVVVIILLVVFL